MSRMLPVAPVVLVALAALVAGCGSSPDAGADPAGPTASTSRPVVDPTTPAPTPTRTPAPLSVKETYTPKGCTLPAYHATRDIAADLFGSTGRVSIAGGAVRSRQDLPDGDVDLVLTRGSGGCQGRAVLTGGGDQDAKALGVRLHVEWPRPSTQVPNRASTRVLIPAQ